MFWNQMALIGEYPWLRSANSDDLNYAWLVSGFNGSLSNSRSGNTNSVRGALQIDLSKIDFTIN